MQETSNCVNTNETAPRYVIVKNKEKNLENSKEKWKIIYSGKTIWLMAEFSSETVEARNIGMPFEALTKRKKSTNNSISSKTILQKMKVK